MYVRLGRSGDGIAQRGRCFIGRGDRPNSAHVRPKLLLLTLHASETPPSAR